MQLVRSAGKRTEAKFIGFGLTPDWFKTQYICFDWLKQVKISFFFTSLRKSKLNTRLPSTVENLVMKIYCWFISACFRHQVRCSLEEILRHERSSKLCTPKSSCENIDTGLNGISW